MRKEGRMTLILIGAGMVVLGILAGVFNLVINGGSALSLDDGAIGNLFIGHIVAGATTSIGAVLFVLGIVLEVLG